MKKLSDCVVVITGASSGIGRATALRIAACRGTLALLARSVESLEEVAGDCRRMGATAIAIPVDVTDAGQLLSAARLVAENFGRIDVWINNAAVSAFGRLEDVPPEAVRRVVEVGVIGYFNGAQAVIPIFREQGGGTLINVSSVAAHLGVPFSSPYAAAKAAVDSLSKSLRMELRDVPGIHVCTLHLSSTDTPFFEHAANYAGYRVKPLRPVFTAQRAARELIRLIHHPRRDAYSDPAAPFSSSLGSLPVIGEALVAGKIERDHFYQEPAPAAAGNIFQPLPHTNRVDGGWGEERHRSGKTGLFIAASGLLGMLAVCRLQKS